MATDVEKVTEASESLRISKQGRYLNTIADFCSTKYEWDFAKTVAILENAIVEGSMMTTIKNNKLSYRINSKTKRNVIMNARTHKQISSSYKVTQILPTIWKDCKLNSKNINDSHMAKSSISKPK